MTFTPDEVRVLKECGREAFYKRSLPLAVASMLGVQLATYKGYIRPHPRWGILWKVCGAGFVGYMVGKFSYQGVCREKLMKLENSPLAEALRRGKSGRDHYIDLARESSGIQEQSGLSRVQLGATDDYQGTLDVDSNTRTDHKGLDDTFRPNVDSDPVYNEPLGKALKSEKPLVTYDELRQQNRSEYNKRFQVPPPETRGISDFSHPKERPRPTAPSSFRQREGSLETKNKYGDAWEETT